MVWPSSSRDMSLRLRSASYGGQAANPTSVAIPTPGSGDLHPGVRSRCDRTGCSCAAGHATIAVARNSSTNDWKTDVNEQIPHTASPFQAIRAIDYTVILVRDMAAMRRFYEDILRFSLLRELFPGWIEYQIGGNILALSWPYRTGKDAPTPAGSASLQLAFKVAAPDVDRCADELLRHGVDLLEPPTDQSFGHRTLFFRDPDGNLLEVFAEI